MLCGLFRALGILLLVAVPPINSYKCQEAVKKFFEFTREADYSDVTIPSGSEITFVYKSYLGLLKFQSPAAYNKCQMEETTVFGQPGTGHKAVTLPIGTHFFALEDYCRIGRKLQINIHSCVRCETLYFDAPFGFGIFRRKGSTWVSQKGEHEIYLKGEEWEISVGQHKFRTSSGSAPDHPPVRASWKHQDGVEFDIVMHCDVCQDDRRMGCQEMVEGYCSDEIYSSLMRLRCPRTCGYYELMKEGFALTTKSIEIHTKLPDGHDTE